MKALDIPKSGKCGKMVWQSNRYGQYCYPAFIPFNPRTPAQVAVRGTFGAVSKRWRQLTQAQRDLWCAAARTKKTRPRLGQCGRLPGYNYFVKINVPLANRGLPQLDLPPESPRISQPIASPACGKDAFHRVPDSTRTEWDAVKRVLTRFDQPTIGPTLFLQVNQLTANWQDAPHNFAAGVSPPA